MTQTYDMDLFDYLLGFTGGFNAGLHGCSSSTVFRLAGEGNPITP